MYTFILKLSFDTVTEQKPGKKKNKTKQEFFVIKPLYWKAGNTKP